MRVLRVSGLAALLMMPACGGGGGDTEDAEAPDGAMQGTPDTDMAPTPDAGADMAPPVEAPSGLPEGESVWRGSAQIAGAAFGMTFTLSNAGGDVTGRVAFATDVIGAGEYGVTGTWSPAAGRLALAPEDWITRPDVEIELLGFIGDLSAAGLTGRAVDYASAEDNTLRAGATELAFVSGDGAPTTAGDGARGLPTGEVMFGGTMQCRGAEREVEGTLDHDGEGRLEGTLTFGDPTLADRPATFEVSGVHNPTTGGITLVPGVYVSEMFQFLTFFVEGSHDPATGDFIGDLRQNTGACPPDLWRVRF